MNPIEIRGLTKSFGEITALRELSLTVAEGELFGLVGPDGAGKTTTMRLLSAILDPTSGDAWVAGFHIVKEAEAGGLGWSSARVTTDQRPLDGPVCVRTRVRFLLWKGTSESLTFCECFVLSRATGGLESSGSCGD